LQRASIEKKDIQDLQQHTPYYFPKRKKEKKESHPSSEGMQRCKGGGGTEPFIYPCFFVSPELTLAFLFISFGLIRTTATFGVVVGVLVDRPSTSTAFFGGSCYRF